MFQKGQPKIGGPTEAEEIWFLVTDRFYALLKRRGQRVALQAASRAFEAMTSTGASRNHRLGSGDGGLSLSHRQPGDTEGEEQSWQ